jgi:STE24 endopeptidase
MSLRALLLVALLAGPDPAVSAEPALDRVELEPPPAAASGASGAIDPEAATRAYLDALPAGERARSDAYFEGLHWLVLWDFLWGAGVWLLLLHTGASARMRDRSERLSRFKPLQDAAYWVQLAAAAAVLALPLDVYQGWFRERQYGLSNLGFGGWLGEQAKGLAVSAVLGSLAVAALYAVVRRRPQSWWIGGAAVAVAFSALTQLIAPVALDPLFNDPKRLADARVVRPVLSLARANGIAAGEVWEIDASRQSRRISANVSGLLGTERITLNDNLLRRCSLPEIEAVMAHEMGHYVLNHAAWFLLALGVAIASAFALVSALFERLRIRWQARWQVRGIGDTAGLPLVALLFSAFFFLLTPAANSLVRAAEYEADLFGLNAARQPDGFAQVSLKLAEYRKLEPSRLEEIVFYDHPSGRTRILAAMRWKAEHPETWGGATASAPAR